MAGRFVAPLFAVPGVSWLDTEDWPELETEVVVDGRSRGSVLRSILGI